MGAYIYPIKVNKEKQKVKTVKSIKLPDRFLTISDIAKHLKEGDKFSISEIEQGVFNMETILTVHSERLETNEEQKTRVSKELLYMAEYNKRQKNKSLVTE